MKVPRVRLDLLIAVCALLISSLAAGASYWQARVMEVQTNVLQQQLGAQVWPYIGTSMSIADNTVKIGIENDGLGPAILRNAVVTVDGKSESSFLDVLHAVLGPHLVARGKVSHETNMRLDESTLGPGSVLRSGQEIDMLTFSSKRFAGPMESANRRINVRICYCAVLPGKCWLADTSSTKDPQPLGECPNEPRDLLHAPVPDAAALRDF